MGSATQFTWIPGWLFSGLEHTLPSPTGGPRWLGPGSSVNNALELAFPNPRWLPEPE